MCGIAGFVGRDAGPTVLAAMTEALAHRGPDGAGAAIWEAGGADGAMVGFGHRRLAILDLSDGAQPMTSACGRYSVTYNGEIYNFTEVRAELEALGHRFASQCDTEVLLEAWAEWGARALERFVGMYAFALFDRRHAEVHFARDPFGKKPLLYIETEDGLVFASEAPALFAHPAVTRSIDAGALRLALQWRYVPGPRTLFEGVRKLAPGTLMTWSGGRLRERRVFAPPETRAPASGRGGTAEDLAGLLRDAVRLRLRSDVPVGMFLSGGLDSAAVLAQVAQERGRGFPCYSVGFSDADVSELEDAREIAAHFGATFVPVMIGPEDFYDTLARLSAAGAAPIAEPADVAVYMMAHRARQDVTVILTGEGADEMFAGYPKHAAEQALGRARWKQGVARHLARGAAQVGLGGHRVGVFARALGQPTPQDRLIQWFGGMTGAEADAIWQGPPPDTAIDPLPFTPHPEASALRRALHFDQTSWLPDNVLDRTDRMTMAASVEARVPFLDVRIADFATGLPDSARLRGGRGKRILREAMAGTLPRAVLTRRKLGFPMPLAPWFRGPLRGPLLDVLGPSSRIAEYVERRAVTDLLAGFEAGQRVSIKDIWMLFTFEMFLHGAAR